MEIGTCDNGATIAQKVEVTTNKDIIINALIEWQTCNEGSCLPPTEQELKIKLPAIIKSTKLEESSSTNVVDNKQQEDVVINEDNKTLVGEALEVVGDEYLAEESKAQADTEGMTSNSKSLWGVILEAIIWGFVALLTPCVFPMVPMTVSFFLKGNGGSKSRGRFLASFYGFCIVALYTLPIAVIILVTYLIGGDAITADIFNWLATHWIPNVLFFIIFMVFAASFFGAFEITMPSWMVNKSDAKSDKGGLIGVFFMALTLVLVSFSCTGPIVSSVLIKSTQGDVWEPIITMFAFSAAFALPFTIFAFAPSLLQDLPKSGGWLNSVKVVLCFIYLALGLNF